MYAEKLKAALQNITPPQIGYTQTATIIDQSPSGETEENKIIIIYANDLNVIDFAEILK